MPDSQQIPAGISLRSPRQLSFEPPRFFRGTLGWRQVAISLRAQGGFPEARVTVSPEALVQTCIVHLIRYSMQFASWKERKAIAAALKPVYGAESAAAAATRLGSGYSVRRLSSRHAANHIYDQRDQTPA
jgi:hypothetical protein